MKSSLPKTSRRSRGGRGRVLGRGACALWLGLAAGVLPAASVAQNTPDPDDLRALFPKVATIEAEGVYGLARAPLPAEVLEAVRADLADLRVFVDGESAEFVVEAEPPREPIERRALSPIEVRERPTGDRANPGVEETWDVVLPSDAPAGADGSEPGGDQMTWELHFGFTAAELVRELSVHRVEPDGTEHELLRSTLFRMSGPLREKLSVSLAPAPGARLRIRVSGPAPAHRPPVTLVCTGGAASPRELRVPLQVVSSERDVAARETIVTLRRPRGIAPDTLVFETTSGAFHREVVVEDAGVGARRSETGRGVIYAIPSWGEEQLEVPLGRTRGDLLRVRILDLDAPPLAALQVEARVRQPALVFEARGGAAQLYFGGARATHPYYGLAGLRDRLTPGADVRAVQVAASADNPRFRAGPVLAFAMRSGAPLEVAGFSHVQTVRVGATPEGLIRVQPELATLAVAREDQGDFRIVDAEGRQWPYLWGDEWLERSAAADVGQRLLPAERSSALDIALPAGGVRVDHVLLDVEDSLIRRGYEVWGSYDAESEPVMLRAGTLERSPGTRGPLRVDVQEELHRLELRVHDGDEQALHVPRVTVVTKARDLFFAAPPGEYRLLVGNARVDSPVYDIESARELVLSLRAVDATVGELRASPDYAPPSPSRDAMTEAALLGVVGLAVLLLGLLTFRLVRSEPDPGAAATDGARAESDERAGAGEPAAEETTSARTDADPGRVATADQDGDREPAAGAEADPDSSGPGASPGGRDKLPE